MKVNHHKYETKKSLCYKYNENEFFPSQLQGTGVFYVNYLNRMPIYCFYIRKTKNILFTLIVCLHTTTECDNKCSSFVEFNVFEHCPILLYSFSSSAHSVWKLLYKSSTLSNRNDKISRSRTPNYRYTL